MLCKKPGHSTALGITPDEQNLGSDVSEHDAKLGRSFCQNYSEAGCLKEMHKFGLIALAKSNFKDPSSAAEAKNLFKNYQRFVIANLLRCNQLFLLSGNR